MNSAVVTGNHPLSERSRQVCRRVSAHPQGIGLAALAESLAGVVDVEPLKSATASLRQTGYLEFQGTGPRWGRWCITNKIPLGEQVPAWLAAAEHDAAIDANDASKATSHRASPNADQTPRPAASVFQLAQQVHGQTMPAVAPASPRFAILSTGSLQLIGLEFLDANDQPVQGGQSLTLAPETTRALFAWLDRLGGTTLSRLSEAA